MLIRVEAKGSPAQVVPAFTALGNDAVERGLRVTVGDPAALAMGGGRFEVELPNVEDEDDGRAAVLSLIDQVPGGANLFTIIDRE